MYSDNVMLEPGQMIETEIVQISDEWIFISFGGKSEGFLDISEVTDKEGNITVNTGDKINVYFVSSQKGEMHFTTKIGGAHAGPSLLQKAYEDGIPVEGFVEKEIKGGFEVKVGNTRTFCPFSQMGLERVAPEKYIGKHLLFIIAEFKERGRNIVLSNRAILEEEQAKKKEELIDTLETGMKIKGIVKSIQDFGAFVDIGGVQALLPISEISRSRVEDIKKELKIDQEIEAVIMSLDWEKDRISLSIKETLPDPWDDAEKKYPEGSRHTGKIVRLTNFGAFVTLESGLDGLIHISDLGGSTRIKHPREVVNQGQNIEVQVNSVDTEKKRISLAPIVAAKQEESPNEFKDKEIDSYKPMGNLGDLLKNKFEDK